MARKYQMLKNEINKLVEAPRPGRYSAAPSNLVKGAPLKFETLEAIMKCVTFKYTDIDLLDYKALQAMVREFTRNAKAKGFWKRLRKSREAAIPERLMLIVSELAEALEEHRNHHAPKEIYYGSEGKPEGIPIELADALIRILNLCGEHDIDIGEAVKIKHRYNKTRSFKHGNKKC